MPMSSLKCLLLLSLYGVGALVPWTAFADRRTKPYEAPERARDSASYLINFWVTPVFQMVSGQIVDGSGPVETPEDTVTDLEADLGLDPHLALGLGLKFEHKNRWLPDVRFDYLPLQFDGVHALSKNLRVGQMSFRENQVVKTSLHAVAIDFTFLYHPLRLGTLRRPWLEVALGATLRSTQALLKRSARSILARALRTCR